MSALKNELGKLKITLHQACLDSSNANFHNLKDPFMIVVYRNLAHRTMTKGEKIKKKAELQAIAKKSKKTVDPKLLEPLRYEKEVTKNGIEYTFEETFEFQIVDLDDQASFELRDDMGTVANQDNYIGSVDLTVQNLINRAGEHKWYTLFYKGTQQQKIGQILMTPEFIKPKAMPLDEARTDEQIKTHYQNANKLDSYISA